MMERPRSSRRTALLPMFAGALTLFHVWLLWTRVAGARAWDAVAALRWIGAAILLSAWLAVRRRGSFRKEHALVWAALVLLLHAAGGPAAEAQVSWALTLSALLLSWRRKPALVEPLHAFGFGPVTLEAFFPKRPGSQPFAARPPPLRFAH